MSRAGGSRGVVADIQLSGGLVALVDANDLPLVSGYAWHITSNGRHQYAQTCVGRQRVKMHRLLTNAPSGLVVDHINGNSLDNRRENLRVVTSAVNSRNRTKADKDNRSGFLGVSKNRKGWRARLTIDGQAVHLGTFSTPEEASSARRQAELSAFGEHCAAHR